jgi:hypothetical protein
LQNLDFLCRFGYADLADPSDLEKALELNGQELKGDVLTVQKAKTPGTPSTPRGNTFIFAIMC